MNSFQWSLPTNIVFGLGELNNTHKHLNGLGKKAFIVTSPSFTNTRKHLLENLKTQLKKIGVESDVFSEIEPNPRTTTIDKAASQLRAFQPRFVIAFGGGSVMDAGKCLALLGKNDGKVFDYAYKGPKTENDKRKKFNSALPLVCIPTVAATSSETDSYAVVTNWEEKKKVVVWGSPLLPTLSIIDPELTYTVNPEQTIWSSFDIITHLIEEYLTGKSNSPIQDRMSEVLIRCVVEALPKALENPKDSEARSTLSWCASLALCGVLKGRNGNWPIHAIEHGISAYSDMAHGKGLALLLPRIMKFDAEVISKKLIQFNKAVFNVDAKNPEDAMNEGLIAYMKKVGAWWKMTDSSMFDQIADHALEIDGVWKRGEEPFLPNIRPMKKQDILNILSDCLT